MVRIDVGISVGIIVGISVALARHFFKHPIDRTDMEMQMPVQTGSEPVDVDLGFCQSDCANVQRRLICCMHIKLAFMRAPGVYQGRLLLFIPN